MEVPREPREPELASRINEIRRFKPGNSRQGLCETCLGSGFVHVERGGTVGVLSEVVTVDGQDVERPVRCNCPKGKR